MKEFWDFDEDDNFEEVTSTVNNRIYKVISRGTKTDKQKVANTLANIDNIIEALRTYLKRTEHMWASQSYAEGLYIYINTPIYLQEMPQGTIFEGLNKPREITTHKNAVSFGKDKKLRARYRRLFLTIRQPNGKFVDKKHLLSLVAHELAHTMANHVQWRDDDHKEDFQLFEQIILNWFKKNGTIVKRLS